MSLESIGNVLRVVNIVLCCIACLTIAGLSLVYQLHKQRRAFHYWYSVAAFLTADAIAIAEYNSVGRKFSISIVFFSACLVLFYIGAVLQVVYTARHWSDRRGGNEF